MTPENFVSINNLSKSYTEGKNQLKVLSHTSLQIQAGQFIALLGRSGSGKSTLLNLIAGIDTPTEGSIRIGTRNLTELSETDRTLFRREHIGFIFQSFNLIPTLTVRENLLLPLELNPQHKANKQESVNQLLTQLKLSNRIDSFPDRLSGGEQQRIAIARALIHQPLLVLADEPTGNLDDNTSTIVVDLLEKMVRQAGHTMIVATHSKSMASNADRVLSIHEGHLVEIT
ncbi:MAG: ABC transporter ATP-binding protein [SAR324 cluster bacterium]|nr:ABC transporter ATP-binding protein [SAR324 cluster bacterium]